MKTVGIELSIQLKNAGYPQVGLFMWDMDSKLRVGIGTAQAPHYKTAFPDVLEVEVDSCITAPTVDEVLDRLPQTSWESYNLLGGRYVIWYRDAQKNRVEFIEDNLANAAAKMWIYLKKEGLI